jgi:pyruvate dehydrogenase E2 component (dihydrolipoamide acetyltransferase)
MDILMPQLGETVTEGKVTNWYKSVGDSVSPGENLFEIETDKTSMEVPTTVAGVISEIRVLAGATVSVGSVVAVLSAVEGVQSVSPAASVAPVILTPAPAKAAFDPQNPVRSPAQNFGSATLPNGIKSTPLARRLAAQNQIDLSKAQGSGPRGRIVAKDIEAILNSADGQRKVSQVPRPLPSAAGIGAAQVKAIYSDVQFEESAIDGMRRTIAKRLTDAKQNIPHFYLSTDIVLDRVIALRGELNALDEKTPQKLSLNDFFIKAMAIALQRVPQANAVWAEESILRFTRSDIGVAVSVESGLFTPVIRSADSKSIGEIAKEMRSLIERARAKALKPGDYQGGSVSLSNLGMFGVSSFSAIINPPQAAILAVGASERRPQEGADGSVYFANAMTATLSCDHRVIDGVLGAQLLSAFKNLLQAPLTLVV